MTSAIAATAEINPRSAIARSKASRERCKYTAISRPRASVMPRVTVTSAATMSAEMPCFPPASLDFGPSVCGAAAPWPFYTAFRQSSHSRGVFRCAVALGQLFGEPLVRHGSVNRQSFGCPIAREPAAELAADDSTGEHAAEAFVLRRSVDGRPAMLFPCQCELAPVREPIEMDAAGWRRQGPVFGGVRRKLVQEQREARHGAPGDRHVGSKDRHALGFLGPIDIRRQNRSDESLQGGIGAGFLRRTHQPRARQLLSARERIQPGANCLGHVLRRVGGAGTQRHDATRDREQVFDAVTHLSKQKTLLLLGPLALGDVASDLRRADDLAVGILY